MDRPPTLSEKQIESIAESTGRVNLWEGSIRSGKTFASILRWLTYCADAPHGGELVIIAKNRDSAYRNIFKPIEEAPALQGFSRFVHYRSGAPIARIFGREVHVIGANDAKAESKIRGMTVAGAYVDEVTVLPVDFFKQLLGRMSVPGAQLFGTTNPDSPAHWLKVNYLDQLGKLPDWRRFHFTLDDNPGLTREYIESLKREYTGLWYKRFILGLWVSAEGAIFDMWDTDLHTIPWTKLPAMESLISIGIDYGTTNASAALLLGLSREEQMFPDGHRVPASRLYLVDEWRYDPSKGGGAQVERLAPSLQAKRFRKWVDEPHLPYVTRLKPEFSFIDPAATHFRQELYQPSDPELKPYITRLADNNVSYGLGRMASLLAEHQLVVAAPTESYPDRGCPGFILEAPGYSWDDKKTLEGADVPVKIADHSLDGGRYAVVSAEARWADRIQWDRRLELPKPVAA